jgi:DUF4097 and DUF4098 domain-containing protein YvlB
LKQAINPAGVVVLTLVALAGAVQGQETRVYREGGTWVQETKGNLGSARNLRVKLGAGSVRVQGGPGESIGYIVHRKSYNSSEEKARHEFESYRISASVKGDTAWIVAESGRRDSRCSDDFAITVPRNLDSARLETGSGNVEAMGIQGRVDLDSGGGSLRVDDIGGEVLGQTGGGSIEVGSVQSGVRVETGGGNIKIASAKGEIKAGSGAGSVAVLSGGQGAQLQTGAGSIRVGKCGGPVRATSGGGSVELGEIGGPAEIQTGAGSIRLASSKGRVRAVTGGGSIQLDGAASVQAETSAGGIVVKLQPSGAREDSTLETSAGDITVYLASDVAVSVRASIEVASGHSIQSDFSDIRVSSEGGQWGPKTVTAEGQLNGGGPVLKVRTNSGNVSFRRIAAR